MFFAAIFKGNPIVKHQKVDAENKYSIEPLHFGIWLNYWFETLNFLFEGNRTELAKSRTRNMGSHLYLKVFESRPKE